MSALSATSATPPNPPQEVVDWYDAEPKYKGDLPALGTIAAAMVVLNRLTDDFSLDMSEHLSSSGGQIKGQSRGALLRILDRFDVDLPRAEEGGRTNRGNVGAISRLLGALDKASLDTLPQAQRTAALDESLAFVVGKYIDWHNRQRIEPKYDPAEPTELFIAQILEAARKKGIEGAVAQHLVGAALQRRFPDEDIANQRVSAADQQTRRGGDFEVGDTPVHVTVAPAQLLINKCERNVRDGLRPLLITGSNKIALAAGLADQTGIGRRLVVRALEPFVAEIAEQLGGYSRGGTTTELREYLALYNERVEDVEIDSSMLVEIPANL